MEVDAFKERRRNSPLRAIACRFLMKYGGLTQREIAGVLFMGSGAAVCLQAKKFDEFVGKDLAMRKKVARLEKRFEQIANDS